MNAEVKSVPLSFEAPKMDQEDLVQTPEWMQKEIKRLKGENAILKGRALMLREKVRRIIGSQSFLLANVEELSVELRALRAKQCLCVRIRKGLHL